jgi:hypothetical protein
MRFDEGYKEDVTLAVGGTGRRSRYAPSASRASTNCPTEDRPGQPRHHEVAQDEIEGPIRLAVGREGGAGVFRVFRHERPAPRIFLENYRVAAVFSM